MLNVARRLNHMVNVVGGVLNQILKVEMLNRKLNMLRLNQILQVGVTKSDVKGGKLNQILKVRMINQILKLVRR